MAKDGKCCGLISKWRMAREQQRRPSHTTAAPEIRQEEHIGAEPFEHRVRRNWHLLRWKVKPLERFLLNPKVHPSSGGRALTTLDLMRALELQKLRSQIGDARLSSQEEAHRLETRIVDNLHCTLDLRLKKGDLVLTTFDDLFTDNKALNRDRKSRGPRRQSDFLSRVQRMEAQAARLQRARASAESEMRPKENNEVDAVKRIAPIVIVSCAT